MAKKKRKPKGRDQSERADFQGFTASFWVWVAGVISAFTLFSALQSVLELAAWARWLVTNWHWAIVSFWQFAFNLVGQDLVAEAAAPLTLFVTLLAISFSGMILQDRHEARSIPKKSFWRWAVEKDVLMRFFESVAIATCSMIVFRASLEPILSGTMFDLWRGPNGAYPGVILLLSLSCMALMAVEWGIEELGHGILLVGYISLFYVVIALPSALQAIAGDPERIAVYRAVVLDTSVFWMPLHIAVYLRLASPRFINYRFTVVLLVLASIFVLNFVSLLTSR